MAEAQGDFGGTALSTAWILHIIGIILVLLGIFALWFVYSLENSLSGSTSDVSAWLISSAAGIVGSIASALAYSLWTRPALVAKSSVNAPARLAAVGIFTIVFGALSLPAFYLGGGLLIITGAIYALVAYRAGHKTPTSPAAPVETASTSVSNRVYAPRAAVGEAYPPAIWVRCVHCGKPCDWPSQKACPRCGAALGLTYR